MDIIYLDFQKAFDTVPHTRVLEQINGYDITSNLLKWMENFLKDIQQRVVLNNSHSMWAPVTSGIPQGSVLGLILFTIYINYLPDMVINITKLFADDTKIYSTVNYSSDKENLQKDVNALIKFSDTWLLIFNNNKRKYLHLGQYSDYTYNMEGKEIKKTNEEKDLGIIVDTKLKFTQHKYKG